MMALTGSYFAVVLCFLLGVFVDADHEVDYFMREKKITFKVKKFCTRRLCFFLYTV